MKAWVACGLGTAVCTFLAGASTCSPNSSPTGINNQPQGSNSAIGGGSTSTATAKPIAHLGDSIALRGNGSGEQVNVQLVKIVDPASSTNQYIQPDQGKHYAAVQLRITNSGSVAYSDSVSNDTKALDAQGQSFSPDYNETTAGPSFASLNVSPGAVQLGFVTFQIPNGDAITKLQFTTNSGFGQTGEWLVP